MKNDTKFKSKENLNVKENTLKKVEIDDVLEGKVDSSRPKVVVIYGGPMTGKSTIIKKVKKLVNVDNVKLFDTDFMSKDEILTAKSDYNIVFTNRSMDKLSELYSVNDVTCNIIDVMVLPELTKKQFKERAKIRLEDEIQMKVIKELNIEKYFKKYSDYKKWTFKPRKSYTDHPCRIIDDSSFTVLALIALDDDFNLDIL